MVASTPFSSQRPEGLSVQARAVWQVAAAIGTIDKVCSFFSVSENDLSSWLRGQVGVPRNIFFKALDFVINDLSARDRLGNHKPAVAMQSPRRILVVDDNVDTAVTLASLLRFMGHTAESVHDGLSVLAAARRFRPDFVFLDIGLPGLDGFQVASALRREPDFGRLTIVAMTGWGNSDDRDRSQQCGIDHYLVKPLDIAFVESLVGRATPTQQR